MRNPVSRPVEFSVGHTFAVASGGDPIRVIFRGKA